jgi:hypothetical protein
MDKTTRLPGTLTIITDANVKDINLALEIPAQTIYLRGYRIEMASAANALTEKVLYLDIPRIFNINKMLDGNVGQVYLPIFLDNAAVTHTFGMDIPVSMAHHLSEKFTLRILDSSFQPVSNLVSAGFMFYLSEGRL